MFIKGKFYQHTGGRCITVVGEVETYKWGVMFVVEEADKTGHGISCIDKTAEKNDNWTEIGKAEFMQNFEDKKDA